MKIKKLVSLLTITSLILASVGNAIACTSLLITDLNGNAYHGRTLEFSNIIPTNMTYFPAGTKIESFTPAGKTGKTFNTKYALIGMGASLVPNAKQVSFADGMNDQGLSMKTNWLNTTTDVPVGNDDSKILAVTDLYP
jgi:penicillin V acylase-like amidase (Ntn superfamily)